MVAEGHAPAKGASTGEKASRSAEGREPSAPRQVGEDARGSARLRARVSGRLVSVLSLIAVLAVWEVWGRQVNPLFASYPSGIAYQFWDLAVSGELFSAFFESMRSLVVGYLLAVVVGVFVGLAMGSSRMADAALNLYVWAGFSTPMVALVPLFILWLGLGFATKVAMVFTMAVFPIIINTADGVRSVPRAWVEVGRAFAAKPSTIVRTIVLPATLAPIMTGLRIGIGRGVVGMIVAEFFTAVSGLGGIIITAGNNFQTDRMFVPIIILMMLGWGLTTLMTYLERVGAPWHAEFTGRQRR